MQQLTLIDWIGQSLKQHKIIMNLQFYGQHFSTFIYLSFISLRVGEDMFVHGVILDG